MRRFLSYTCALLLAFGAPVNALLAADYFVINNGGPTGGTGSAGDPFGTITEAIANAPWAAGDTLNVAAGTYDAANGESFPLDLPNGVTLAGAGLDFTTITGSGGVAAIRHLGGNDTTIVRQVEIVAGSLTSGVMVTQPVEDFQVRDCRFLGCQNAVGYGAGGMGPVGMIVKGNTMIAPSRKALRFDHSPALGGIAGGVVVNFSANQVFGSGVATDGVEIDIDSNGLGAGYAIVNDNLFSSIAGTAVDFDCFAGYMIGEFAVARNTIANANHGILGFWGASSSGTVQADPSVSDNVVSSVSDYGIGLLAVAGFFSTANFDGTVSGNSVIAAGNAGIGLSMSTYFSGFAFGDVNVRRNRVADGGGNGIDLFNWGSGFGLSSQHDFRSNVITGQAGNGVALGTSNLIHGGGGPDFGRQGDPGRNTIQGNATSGSAYEYSVSATSNYANPLYARGNFWGSLDLADIEAGILHGFDDSARPTVDFGFPLAQRLRFAPDRFAPAAGRRVEVRTVGNSRFVPYAGQTAIAVTLNGTPAANVVVGADGRTLKCDLPKASGKTLLLIITNPGGQSGSFLLRQGRGLSVGTDQTF